MNTRKCAFFVIAVLGCTSGPQSEESRSIGCLWPSLSQRAQTEHDIEEGGKRYTGKLLPRVVKVLGPYVDKDGFPLLDEDGDDQVRVVILPNTDPAQWVPVKRKSIKFVGCGPETAAFMQLQGSE